MLEPLFIEKRFYDRRLETSGIHSLKEISAYNRINTLSTIVHAGRGWIGASLSCAELLTVLYFDVIRTGSPDEFIVILGKGHAAPMQYSCLAGLGVIPVHRLKTYKRPEGLQAHTDITTPGIPTNTGSLGQSLSKACGMAMSCPQKTVYVILGDGELQEGQNFEAFQTMYRHTLRNLVPIIDRNGIQSDSSVSDIKPVPDLEAVLAGFGLAVRRMNGNSIEEVRSHLSERPEKPTVFIADTLKGRGISFMEASDTGRRAYLWHGGVPESRDYGLALRELAGDIQDPELISLMQQSISSCNLEKKAPAAKISCKISTGEAFSAALLKMLSRSPDLYVFDADLEKPCRLRQIAADFPDRYVEMGIAEQDMVSCAGGFALSGKIPVVNTYSAFLRRAYEQIYVNATERTRIIYAGHYSGLCYTTDGKTHQCTGDIAMMNAIPGMIVLYPAFPEEVHQMLDWYMRSIKDRPVFIRLHRTPPSKRSADHVQHNFDYGSGQCVFSNHSRNAVLTSGPHMTEFCTQIAAEFGFDLYSVSSLSFLSPEFIALLEGYERLFIFEELVHSGGLLDLAGRSFCEYRKKQPETIYRGLADFTCCTLEPDGLYKIHGLDTDSLRRFISSSLQNIPEKK